MAVSTKYWGRLGLTKLKVTLWTLLLSAAVSKASEIWLLKKAWFVWLYCMRPLWSLRLCLYSVRFEEPGVKHKSEGRMRSTRGTDSYWRFLGQYVLQHKPDRANGTVICNQNRFCRSCCPGWIVSTLEFRGHDEKNKRRTPINLFSSGHLSRQTGGCRNIADPAYNSTCGQSTDPFQLKVCNSNEAFYYTAQLRGLCYV